MPEQIIHPALPAEVIVSFQKGVAVRSSSDKDQNENISGANLIKKTALTYLNEPDIHVITQKNEKPRAFVQGNEISISFSHTRHALALAMSRNFNVGCDMESVERKVSPSLMNRLRCTSESEELYHKISPVQIWTLKEAALKMIGSGLRKPMNSVLLRMIGPENFDVEFSDGKRAKICSFRHNHHWISICYHK